MSKKPIGCGVVEHAEDCLCDVVITNPTEFKLNFPHDLLYGSYIAEKIGWSPPFTREKLAEFMDVYLDTFAKIWRHQELTDMVARGVIQMDEAGKVTIVQTGRSGLSSEAFDYIKQRINENASPTAITNEVSAKFGENTSRGSIHKIKDRMVKWGEYAGK